MKILVLSDSHGNTDMLTDILKKERSCDIILHLGDGSADLYALNEFTYGKVVYQLKGNCDAFAYKFPEKLITSFGEMRLFACHGHHYNVKSSLTALYFAALQEKCSLVLYGHTHKACKEEYEDAVFLNPGSASAGKYAIIKSEDSDISFEMHNLLQQ